MTDLPRLPQLRAEELRQLALAAMCHLEAERTLAEVDRAALVGYTSRLARGVLDLIRAWEAADELLEAYRTGVLRTGGEAYRNLARETAEAYLRRALGGPHYTEERLASFDDIEPLLDARLTPEERAKNEAEALSALAATNEEPTP